MDGQSALQCLRLCCCTCDDVARAAFTVKDNSLTRSQLDARNNIARPQTFEEVVADLFNDPDNVYYTKSLPDLHADFNDEIELKFEPKYGEIMAEDVKNQLGNTRAILIKIIPNWEQSGKGFGAERSVKDVNHGRITEEIIHEHGDRRANFLSGFKSHVLYYWDICDNQGILQNVLSVLDENVSADSDKPAATTAVVQSKRKKKGKSEDDIKEQSKERLERKKLRKVMSTAMHSLAHTSLATELRETEREWRMLKLEKLRAKTQEEESIYSDSITSLKERVDYLRKRIKEDNEEEEDENDDDEE